MRVDVTNDAADDPAWLNMLFPTNCDGTDEFGDEFLDDEFHDEKLDDDDDGTTSPEQAPSRDGETTAGDGGRIGHRRNWIAGGLILLTIMVIAVALGFRSPDQTDDASSSNIDEEKNTGAGPSGPSTAPVQIPSQPSSPATPSADVKDPTNPPIDPDNMSRDEYLAALAQEWSGGAALEDEESAASLALGWLIHLDPMQLTTKNAVLDIQQRYVPALLWFAMDGRFWRHEVRHQRRRRAVEASSSLSRTASASMEHDRTLQGNTTSGQIDNFLSGLDVCFWKTPDGERGVICDEIGLIRELQLGKRFRCLIGFVIAAQT